MQEIFISLDDSGKLSTKEKICVYAGLVIFSQSEKNKFITKYKAIINNIKCSYCPFDKNCCNSNCPEIKNINIKANHKRRLLNLIKTNYIISVVIDNAKIYEHIMNDKASKGRYVDYALRLLIKGTIKQLISLKKIDPYKPVKVIINIDQQSTKSNGYYSLKDGLYEELIHGIKNFNYKNKYKPLLFSNLQIELHYQNSKCSYLVQAADLIAGTVRKNTLLMKENDKLVDYMQELP